MIRSFHLTTPNGRTLTQNAWVHGVGQGPITGHWVVNGQPQDGLPSHAVLGTVSFVSPKIYISDPLPALSVSRTTTRFKVSKMHLFNIYDPNYPGNDDRGLGTFDDGGPSPTLLFTKGSELAEPGMWVANPYHTPAPQQP